MALCSFDQLSRWHLQTASEAPDRRQAGVGEAGLQFVDRDSIHASRQATERIL